MVHQRECDRSHTPAKRLPREEETSRNPAGLLFQKSPGRNFGFLPVVTVCQRDRLT